LEWLFRDALRKQPALLHAWAEGSYFSPQQYFLFKVPVHGTGVYRQRLQYTISGSLGAQHFAEDPSDFYPSDAALQATTGHRYPAFASTGATFNFDARLNYQIARPIG
jgi:hypothetical protein